MNLVGPSRIVLEAVDHDWNVAVSCELDWLSAVERLKLDEFLLVGVEEAY